MFLTQLADLLENVRVALDGLLSNKMRSALTMLGVVIGVAAVIALMSIGTGAQESITSQINSMGTNMLIVTSGGMGRVGGPGGRNLTMEDAEALADPNNVPTAAIVAPEYSGNAQIIFGDTNQNASVSGVRSEYQKLNELVMARGEFITSEDVERRLKVVVLGASVAEDLFGTFNPIGQKIKVVTTGGATVSLKVVGVLKEEGDSMLSSTDDKIFVPLSTAQTKIFNARNTAGKLTVSRINIMSKSEELVNTTESEIDTLLRDRHGIDPDADADFNIMNQADMLSAATSITGTLTAFLGAIAGISLLVGGIGIMNIMLVSVTERTREVGLRKAVGARKGDVLLQFLLEAVMLSLIGGIIGILLGVGAAQIVSLTGLITAVVSAWSVLLAVGFSFAIGVFFGIYPANKAANLNPIEALRYE